MWGYITITLLLTLFGASAEAGDLSSRQPGVEEFFLGTVEGKSYLADNATLRTWDDARTYCRSIGMRLASITTIAQKNFINGINNRNFQTRYWTAARDARSHQQFVWDHDASSLSPSLINIIWFEFQSTCVFYDSRQDYKRYSAVRCTDKYGALCESN